MKRIIASALALTMAVGAAGTASAQPYGYGHDRHDHGGYGHSHRWHDRSDWRRGGYVARSDWGRGHVVVDYRHHHLRRPPRGYEWREIDGRYVLAAVASGIIADIILNAR